MSLTDGDVAALARQAVDLLDPDLDIAIKPVDPSDPYRWGRQAWIVEPLIDDEYRRLGIHLDSGHTPVEALQHLIDHLDEASETKTFWGQAFPRCVPGHVHPAQVEADSSAVVLRCPQTSQVVQRLVPDVPD
jgi:hypothetical protein